MIEDNIKDEIQSCIQLLYKKHLKTAEIIVEKPKQMEHGDFASNIAFVLSSELKRNPQDIAIEIAKSLKSLKNFEDVTAISGFINFRISKKIILNSLKEILENKEKYARNNLFEGKNVQVEFISANPTGPLTLANGRGGYAGDVIANLFAFSNAKIEREYYVNDGGNQVKILGDSILVAAGLLKKDEDIYKGEYIDNWTRNNKEVIENFKDNPFKLGQKAAVNILEKHIKPSVSDMKIKFDVWFSENEMIESGLVEKVIADLKKYKMTKEKEGALWFKSTKYGDEKDRVLVKSDGEKTYFVNDISYLFDKLYNRKFDKVINLWGADHHGHVAKMFAAEKALGCENHLEIILTQMVRLIKGGKEFKMSKRKGTYITIDDLLNLIGGEKSEASDVARFFFLSRSTNTHMDFDLDLAKEQSEKNPVYYVKYAYARIHGILANAKAKISNSKADLNLLTEPEELTLIGKLSELPMLVQSILTVGDYPVHLLTFYVRDVASAFHRFYDKCRVIDENDLELTLARLELVKATKIILKIVMEALIGIEAPQKM